MVICKEVLPFLQETMDNQTRLHSSHTVALLLL